MRAIHKETLARVAGLQPTPQEILEVGCSNGYFTQAIAYALPHARITALDPDASVLPASTEQIEYLQGSAEDIPAEDGSFDTAIACMSFHHWDNKQRGLHEVYRVLSPKGRLVIGDPFLDTLAHTAFMPGFLQKLDGGEFTLISDLKCYLAEAGFGSIASCAVSGYSGSMFVFTAEKKA